MMIKTLLLNVVLMLFLVGCAVTTPVSVTPEVGFNITFTNSTDQVAVYRLARIDHDYKDRNGFPIIGPVDLAVGEVPPGESREVTQRYPPGLWSVTWKSRAWSTEQPWEVYAEYTIGPAEDTIESILQFATTTIYKSKGI